MYANLKRLKVLTVEDSDDDFVLIHNILTDGGFAVEHERVETAKSLETALSGESWDVVLCDHKLPLLDSMSALKVVRGMAKDVPFIVVSGKITDEMAVEAMRHGAQDFIHKDNLSRLVPVVERELQQTSMRASLLATKKKLRQKSHFDTLTGLPNCEYFFKHLKLLTHQSEHIQPFAILLVDLNRFHKITKTLGVLAGDKVVFDAAGRLRMALARDEFVARIGPDKFGVVTPHLKARETANIIHECLNEVFLVDEQELFIKASVGVSFYPKDSLKWDDLYKNAESALYSAKIDGGNSYQEYLQQMDNWSIDGLIMESELYHASEQKQFVLHYQPQFDLSSKKIIGAEALIRWQHPVSGMIPPNKFVHLLEETGLIVPVGEWVLRSACDQNRKWQAAGLASIRMAVNLSAIQFRQPGLAQTVRKALADTGLAPEYLELEITENIAMNAEQEIIAILNELRAIGIQIAIDDFGTGYSSLSYLKRFPIDKLKIDQAFVRNCQGNRHDDGIVTAIIGIGRSLNLKVIAEGVETREQAEFLKLNGCDEVQGYLYGKPMQASDFEQLMSIGIPLNASC